MKLDKEVTCLFFRLWVHISHRQRLELVLLIALMLIASIAEVISIGMVIPFLTVLADPEIIYKEINSWHLLQLLAIEKADQLIRPLTVIFCLAALLTAALRILINWKNTKISFSLGSMLGAHMYWVTLNQPYSVHCSRNSSEVINGIANKTGTVVGIINSLLVLLCSLMIFFTVVVFMLALSSSFAIIGICFFALLYVATLKIINRELNSNSEKIANETTAVIRSLQEGLGGIRDILLAGNQLIYTNIYKSADLPLRRAQGVNAVLSTSPRFIIEALGITLIALIAYSSSVASDGLDKAIPVLGALALGAQRLLPVMQQAFGAWSSILGSKASFQDALELLDQPVPVEKLKSGQGELAFEHSIVMDNISFQYSSNGAYILDKISLSIRKGDRIGIIGHTGGGKSTFTDIVMGLLTPSGGTIKVDGVEISTKNIRLWQQKIAHVPQNIFLTDSSIEENIAFGVPRDLIDKSKVKRAAIAAQLASTIEAWPDKYETKVGERGIRLSGGQRQRIGIARAYYKEASIIIFDEATSALDNETEAAVMQAIASSGEKVTLIMVAHRLTTLSTCSKIIEIKDGKIQRVLAYKDLVDSYED
jgi:ABC-type bacteriocin/lantibiotic exporter with double-glycine peptidase domain